MPVISDKPEVHALARRISDADPLLTLREAAERALRDFYCLAPKDGIYGGSPAAVCMGFLSHMDEDILPRIVAEVAAELEASEAPNAEPAAYAVYHGSAWFASGDVLMCAPMLARGGVDWATDAEVSYLAPEQFAEVARICEMLGCGMPAGYVGEDYTPAHNPRTSRQMPHYLARQGYRLEVGEEGSEHAGRYWFTLCRNWPEAEAGPGMHSKPEHAIAEAHAHLASEMTRGEDAFA